MAPNNATLKPGRKTTEELLLLRIQLREMENTLLGLLQFIQDKVPAADRLHHPAVRKARDVVGWKLDLLAD